MPKPTTGSRVGLPLALLFLACPAMAAQVLEYIDPSTGALVFDATGEHDEFDVPAEPRVFESPEHYREWVAERFHGTLVYDDRGEIIDVQGAWILRGKARFSWNGEERSVLEPVLQTITGQFGFVIIAGEQYYLGIDEGRRKFEEIEPALFYTNRDSRVTCGGPLGGGSGYCLVGTGWKFSAWFPFVWGYNSIGADVEISGWNTIMTPSTELSVRLFFNGSNGLPVPFSGDGMVNGVYRDKQPGTWSLGYGQWGLLFPTRLMSLTQSITITGHSDGFSLIPLMGQATADVIMRFVP